ncbi:MAG: two-component regulator propeller domain-containing protein [Bacteroidales bacterium]
MQKTYLFFLLFLLSTLSKGEIRLKVNEFFTSDGLPHRSIGCMIQDKDGLMWFATWNGLCSYDGQQFRGYNTIDSLKIGRLDVIAETEKGEIWCQSYDNHFYLFHPATATFSICDTVMPTLLPGKNTIKKKVECIGNRLILYPPFLSEKFEFQVNENKGLESTLHYCYGDKQGNLWVNFNDKLYKFSFLPIRYNTQTRPDGESSPLFNNEVRSFMIDHHNRLWIGCKNKHIYIYNAKNQFIGYFSRNGRISREPVSFDGKVYHMLEDKSGDIWIATKGEGLFRMESTEAEDVFKPTHYHTQNKNAAISNNELYYLQEDRDQNIWTGTFGCGLDKILPKRKDLEQTPVNQTHIRNFWNIFPKNKKGVRVRHFEFIREHLLAVATTDGLMLCNTETGKMQTLGNGNTMQVHKAHNGKIYVATLGQGLKQLIENNHSWELVSVTASQGDLPDVIVSLTEDQEGNIWLISDNYLTKVYSETGITERYGESFFNKAIVFSEAIPVLTRHGDLLLGTASGFIRMNPRKVKRDSAFIPNLIFTDLKINNKHQITTKILPDSLQEFTLNKTDNSFAIQFSALDFINPDNIKYAYSLEKEDAAENWIYIRNHHSISFSNLQKGKYRLRIKSTNSDGVWVPNEKSIIITVESPVRWLLYVIPGCILLLGAGWFVYYRKRQVSRLLEQADKKEEIELNPSCPEIRTQDDIFIEKIMKYMEENMDNPDLSVDVFASYMGYSRSRFYKQMKSAINKTPVDFIREIRIKRATYLFDSHQYNVSEVAFMTGFSDSKYFSKVFKKETGLTPTEYLNKRDNP